AHTGSDPCSQGEPMLTEWWRRWRTRKSPMGTVPAASARPALEPLEDRMLLSANLFQDINGTTASSFPLYAPVTETARLGSNLYFTAEDGIHPNALWKTNGTNGGTVLVTQIGSAPLPGPLTLANLTTVNGRLYFTTDDGVHGNEV